jgi:hypothetical protein
MSDEISFYMQLYHDLDRADWALGHLRKHYPTQRVILLSDGDDNPNYPQLAQKHNAEYTAGERLYGVEHGGKIIHRMLAHMLEKPAKFYIKMDTDTLFHRPFHKLPRGPHVFGTLEPGTGSIQGGCVLLSQKAAQKLYKSKIYESPALLDWANSWGRLHPYPQMAYKAAMIDRKICTDWVFWWGCLQQGVETREYKEIYSTWTQAVPNPDLALAVTHPHKDPAAHPLEPVTTL